MLTHHFRVCMLQLWSSLLVVGLFLPLLAVSEEAPIYQIDECATPVQVTLHGLPSMPIKFEQTLTTCGKMENYVLQPTEIESYKLNYQPPRITLTLHQGKLDVRVELRNDKLPRIYQAMQITLDAKEHALQRVAHEGGPNLSVSVEQIHGSYIGPNVENSPVSQIVRDIAKIKHLHILHIERFCDNKVSLRYQIMQVKTALSMLANTCDAGLIVQYDSKKNIVVGPVKNAKAIDELREVANGYRSRGETIELKNTLEKIVELAKLSDTEHLEDLVPDVLEELVSLVIAEKDYSRAEALGQQRLIQIEKDEGTTSSTNYAFALRDLGHTRMIQGDEAAATILFKRALAMIGKYEGVNSPANAQVLSSLARLAFNNKRFDEAISFNLRAFKILEASDAPDTEALFEASLVEGMLAFHYFDNKEYVLAQPHFERKLTLNEKISGPDARIVDLDREMLITNANIQGKTEHAARLYARQILLSEQRIDRISYHYASALRNLAAIRAAQGNFVEAISLWQRLITLRSEVLHPNHPRVIAAIKDLALLYRLNEQLTEAMSAINRADAIQPSSAGTPKSDKIDTRLSNELELDIARALSVRLGDQLELQQAKLSPGDVALALTYERLGEVHAAMGEVSAAVNTYEQAGSIRLKAQGIDHADTQRTAQRLIELYELGGDSSAAQRVRQHMKALPPLTPTLK